MKTTLGNISLVYSQNIFPYKGPYGKGEVTEDLTSSIAPIHGQTVKQSFLLDFSCMECCAFRKCRTSPYPLKCLQVQRRPYTYTTSCPSQVDQLKRLYLRIHMLSLFNLTSEEGTHSRVIRIQNMFQLK